jgi:hypothetical protein
MKTMTVFQARNHFARTLDAVKEDIVIVTLSSPGGPWRRKVALRCGASEVGCAILIWLLSCACGRVLDFPAVVEAGHSFAL